MSRRSDITVIRTKAHKRAVENSFADIMAFLIDHLGKVLTSEIAGSSQQTIVRWKNSVQTPPEQVERRMRETYHVFMKLAEKDASATVRAWFMGMNPQLDDLSPVEALRDDQFRDVSAAAEAFLIGG